MNNLTMNDVHRLRYMQTKDAEEFLATFGITEGELEKYRPLIGKSLQTVPDTDLYNSPIAQEATTIARQGVPNVPRRLMIGTLWLLGGSNNKIANLLGVTSQTIFAQINKTFPPGKERHSIRYASAISNEELDWYFQGWLKHAAQLGAMSDSVDMARWLKENYPYAGD